MSVFNCFLTPDVAQFPAVVVAAGQFWWPTLLAGAIAELPVGNFDELLKEFPDVLRRCTEKMPAETFGTLIAGLAGWSTVSDTPAFISVASIIRRERIAFDALRSTRFMSLWDPEISAIEFDPAWPVASGLDVMRAQRAKRARSLCPVENPSRSYHVAGGFCQHTAISKDSITVRVVERWLDQIGKEIVVAPPLRSTGGVF